MIEHRKDRQETTASSIHDPVLGSAEGEGSDSEGKLGKFPPLFPTLVEIQKLIFANPMQMEVSRFKRRFLNVTQSPKLNKILSALVVLCYLMVVGVVFAVRKDLPIEPIALLQLALLLLTACVSSHASIAGEKDRRSWDLLQVAPISQHQIVVGKFISSATLLVGLQALVLPLMLMTLGGHSGIIDNLLGLGVVEVISLSVGLFFSASTIYLSSKMRNANATLVASLASLVSLYGLAPLLFRAVSSNNEAFGDFFSSYHPFYWVLVFAQGLSQGLLIPTNGGFAGDLIFMVIAAYLGATLFALTATGIGLTRRRGKE